MALTPREKEILKSIQANPFISQAELARKLGTSRAAVAGHVSGLVKKGWIVGRGYVLRTKVGVTVVGGANLDLKGKPLAPLRPRTSNPGVISSTVGGVGRNIAHNLALLGVPVNLVTAVGADAAGERIRQETRQAGVNLASSLSVPGGRSGIYMALLEEDGDLALAVADMAVIDHLTPEYLRGKADLFRNSRLIVADANLREEALDTLTEMARRAEVPILVEPVSIQKAERLKSLLADVDYVTPNGEELEALTGRVIRSDEELGEAAAWLLDRGLKAVLVTLGPRGLYLATPQVSRFLPPYSCEVVDATGAGDALTAGFVYGLYQGFELEEAARYGLAAASLTISSPETVNPRMSEEAVKQLINEQKAPGGVTG